jgi:hypothetical protein
MMTTVATGRLNITILTFSLNADTTLELTLNGVV